MFENIDIPQDLIPSDPRFGAGPSLVPVEHLQSLANTGKLLLGTSHRKPPIKNLGKEIQEGLKEYFQLPDDYLVCFGNGGATQVFDMIGLGIVEKEITHFTCGEFSKKWFHSSDIVPWIKANEIAADMGQGITPTYQPGSDVIATTLNETSTGVIIDKLPTMENGALLTVDATSGGGQVECDVSKTDIYFFSPQKVFAAEGGFFTAIMSPAAQARAEKISADKSRYKPNIMDWQHHIDNSRKHQVYNTPAISSMFLFNEQIKRLNKVGYAHVVADAKKRAELVYGWAESKDYLSPYVQETRYRSTAVATIDVDDRINVTDLLAVLEKKNIVLGIDPYRKLGRNQFRISMFYNISMEDLEKLTKLLSHLIEASL